MRRVSVVGTTGSGKTTFARQLADVLGVPAVELDALNWGANWTMVDETLFRRRVHEATSGRLDPPLTVILARLWRRSVGRIRSGSVLWGGNRETFRNTFLSRESLFIWALKTHRRRKRIFREQLAKSEYAHLEVHRFTRPEDAERWLEAQRRLVAPRI